MGDIQQISSLMPVWFSNNDVPQNRHSQDSLGEINEKTTFTCPGTKRRCQAWGSLFPGAEIHHKTRGGNKVILSGHVGNDFLGKIVVNEIKSAGIDTSTINYNSKSQ